MIAETEEGIILNEPKRKSMNIDVAENCQYESSQKQTVNLQHYGK